MYRPKTTNTVIRSRTSEPTIRKKLELLANEDLDEESLKPSFTVNRIRKKNEFN